MGFPLSTFQQLSALCRDEPFVRNTFERFKQIAIIVHDPADDGFRRQVKYAFEHLHEVTGEGFAFISFVNPPRRWADIHKDWMEEREMLSAGDGCEDPEFVRALQRRLDLPDGPSLVLADDLLSDRYVILPSSAGELVPQMEAVSDYVNGHPGRIPAHSSEYLSFLSRLGPAFDERTSDGESLAKNIADLIAVRALTGAGAVRDRFARHVQKEDAYSYVRKVLKTLWNDLDTRRADGDEERASESLDRLCEYLGLILSAPDNTMRLAGVGHREHFETRMCPYGKYILEESLEGDMEPLSKTFFANYNRLLPVYFNLDPVAPRGGIDLDRLAPVQFGTDFSPLGNYLGKTVEEEMNASLVQLVRSLLGVRIPLFYRRWDEDLNDPCEVKTRQKSIYLNWKGRHVSVTEYMDKSLAMGEVLCVVRELVKDDSMRRELGLFGDSGYIEALDRFARLRNQACHAGVFVRDEFMRMFSSFREIERDFLPLMINLKKRLRAETFF